MAGIDLSVPCHALKLILNFFPTRRRGDPISKEVIYYLTKERPSIVEYGTSARIITSNFLPIATQFESVSN